MPNTTPPDAILRAIDALVAGLPEDAPLLVSFGDVDVAYADLDALAAGVAYAAEAWLQPYVVRGDETLHAFVTRHDAQVVPGDWRDLTITPTVVLEHARERLSVYAPGQPMTAEVTEALAAEVEAKTGIELPLKGKWEVVHVGDAVALPEAPEPARPSVGVLVPRDFGTFLGARVLGSVFDPESPVLTRMVTYALGKNAEAVRWQNKRTKLIGIFARWCRHDEGAKDGPAFVCGALKEDGPRAAKSIVSREFAGLDIDNGMSGAELDERLIDAGWLAIRYTTHSHLKPETRVPRDKMLMWARRAELEGSDDTTLAQAYLRERGYDAAVVASAEGEWEPGHAGASFIMRHMPMEKHRVILPLAETYEIVATGRETYDEALDRSRVVPEQVARLLGDLSIDKTGSDPNRLFYFPRHAPGAAWEISLIPGRE